MSQINETLQKYVLKAIKWEPILNTAEVGVANKDGFTTLTRIVDSYAKKLEAETTAKNVAGLKVVDNFFNSFGVVNSTWFNVISIIKINI